MSTRSSAVSALLALLSCGACGTDSGEPIADGSAEASTAAAGGTAPGADATLNTGGTGSGGRTNGGTGGSRDASPGATDGRAGGLGAGGSQQDGGSDASVGGAGGGGGSDASVDGEAPDAPHDSAEATTADANGLSWISALFPASRPATITVTATIQENDIECVIVYGGGQCQALYTPPCIPSSRQRTVTLDLTLDENGNLVVEAPYQEMCAPDYFCAVSGPTCPIPTSYAVPTDTTFSFAPRSTDYCRRYENGTPYPVENVVSVQLSGTTLVIDQLCTTHMRNLTSEVIDIRDWTTTIELR